MFDFLKRIFQPTREQPVESANSTVKKLNRAAVMKILSSEGKTMLRNVDLSQEDLSGLNFASVDMDKARFTGSNLTETNFNKAYLPYADLSDANLAGWELIGAQLMVANLSRANLTDADLSNANLSNANLTDANLTRAILLACYLGHAKLTGATMPDGSKYRIDTDLTKFGVRGERNNKLR